MNPMKKRIAELLAYLMMFIVGFWAGFVFLYVLPVTMVRVWRLFEQTGDYKYLFAVAFIGSLLIAVVLAIIIFILGGEDEKN